MSLLKRVLVNLHLTITAHHCSQQNTLVDIIIALQLATAQRP